MRNPFSEFAVSTQVSVSLAALARETVPSGIATRVIKKSRKYETAGLFSTAHLLRNRHRYRYGAPVLNWMCYRPATLLPYLLTRLRPVALRPALSRGLPFSEVKTFIYIVPPCDRCLTFSSKIYPEGEQPLCQGCCRMTWQSWEFFGRKPAERIRSAYNHCVQVHRSEVGASCTRACTVERSKTTDE